MPKARREEIVRDWGTTVRPARKGAKLTAFERTFFWLLDPHNATHRLLVEAGKISCARCQRIALAKKKLADRRAKRT